MKLFIELMCDEYDVPAGSEAIIRLEDGKPHSIDICEDLIVLWDEGHDATVEVISAEDQRVDDALQLAVTWLHNLKAPAEAEALLEAVERREPQEGYLRARTKAFEAFYAGFGNSQMKPASGDLLGACYSAGKAAEQLNRRARISPAFPGLGVGPFDTDTVKSAFKRAVGAVLAVRKSTGG